MSGQIMLATGGTGGHVFPAIALAGKLTARGWLILFVTDVRGERYLPASAPRTVVASASPSGSLGKRLGSLVKLGFGFVHCLFMMIRARPKLIVGFGSYAMVPAIAAAAILRIPILLHEQNAVLGRAHRAASHIAKRVALSHPIDAGLTPAIASISVVTGNPVRAEFERGAPFAPPFAGETLRLVVFGGSQGARLFGEPVAEAVASLPSSMQGRLHIQHQVREDDAEAVRHIYAKTAATVELAPFFDQPSKLIEDAHFVISRAGATIVAELTALGRPSLLIPYAGALDQDQMGNARTVAARGGSVLLTEQQLLDGELAAVLATLLKDPGRLEHIAATAKELGRPQAATILADLVHSMLGFKRGAHVGVDK